MKSIFLIMAITFSQLLTAQNIKSYKAIQEKTLIFDRSDISIRKLELNVFQEEPVEDDFITKKEAFKQVVFLIKNAESFNFVRSYEIISHNFDDLTITIKTKYTSFFGGDGDISLMQLKLKDLKKVTEDKEALSASRNTLLVLTFRNEFKEELLEDEEVYSVLYINSVTVGFEKDSMDSKKFIKALKVLK